MSKIVLFLYIFSLIIGLEGVNCSNPNPEAIVETKLGEFRGFKSESRSGREYSAFRGIEYGQVKTRFQDAEPITKSWTGFKDTLKYGADCAQINIRTKGVSVEENCLFLNVYIPEGGKAKKPVIFYIHGGAWVHGSGRYVGEKFFMDEDVVLVSINYRLGSFGFLALHNSKRAPGNVGMTDTILALTWIQENIEYFQGDKDKVTIMGESAGAGTVSHLIMSPKAKGLFHTAIAHSGSIMNPWAWRSAQSSEPVAFELGTKLGCDTQNSEVLLNCLLKTDVHEILKAEKLLPKFYVDPLVAFMPVVQENDPLAFLPESPLDIINEGRFNKVPTILTLCQHEGLLLHAASIVKSEYHLKELDENWTKNGAIQLLLEQDARLPTLSPGDQNELVLAIKKHYFENRKFKMNDSKTLENLINFYTDRHFTTGIRDSALLMAEHTSVYTGIFTRPGDQSAIKVFGYDKVLGVSHVDDLQFFFDEFGFGPFSMSPELTDYSKSLVKLWVQFANTGIPGPKFGNSEIGWNPVSAKEVSSKKLNWMDLGNIPKILENPYESRLSIWDSMYNIYRYKNIKDEL